jgi:hypothetical protein
MELWKNGGYSMNQPMLVSLFSFTFGYRRHCALCRPPQNGVVIGLHGGRRSFGGITLFFTMLATIVGASS